MCIITINSSLLIAKEIKFGFIIIYFTIQAVLLRCIYRAVTITRARAYCYNMPIYDVYSCYGNADICGRLFHNPIMRISTDF